MATIRFLEDSSYQKKFLGSQDLFFKALGRPSPGTEVWDLTAGLLVDTLFLIQRGLKVRSFENHPEVLKEIKSALSQAFSQEAALDFSGKPSVTGKWFKVGLDQLNLEEADSLMVLRQCLDGAGPQVIYMDPMFDEDARSASALPKKGAQWLRKTVPCDHFLARDLLVEAIRVTADRVVVKRPRLAEELISSPRHSYLGRSVRFDVYFKK